MTQANSPDASMILEADLCDRVVLRLLSNRLTLMNRHHFILTRPLCWPWSPTSDVLDRVRNCQCGLSADVQWVQRSDHGSVTQTTGICGNPASCPQSNGSPALRREAGLRVTKLFRRLRPPVSPAIRAG